MTSANKACAICCEERNTSSFLKITKKCTHENTVCKTCVNTHVQTELERKGLLQIQCPAAGCSNTLSHQDVKKLTVKAVFERYDTLSLNQILQSFPDFRWCKNSKCGAGQIHFERDDAPIMTCNACSSRSCYTHEVPWHDGMTCAAYEEARKAAEKATEDYLQRGTKSCPKCGVHIEKNGGCDHMTCRVPKCSYEFCWLCSADYNAIRKNENKEHATSCKYYA